MEPTAIISAIGNGGAFALLTYLVVYGIPRWIDKMQHERDSDRTVIQRSQSELVTAFKEEQRYERNQCAAQFTEMMAMLNRHHEFAVNSIADLKKFNGGKEHKV